MKIFSQKLSRDPYPKFITVLIAQTLTSSYPGIMVRDLYTVWIEVDETLPWIELKGEYQRRREAREAVRDFAESLNTKIVKFAEKRKAMKSLATIRASR